MNIALKNRLLGLHKASVYAMVVMAFLCVVVGGGVGAVLGTVFVVGAVASWFVDRAQMLDPERARRWGNALVVVFIAVSAAHLLTTEAGAIYAAIRFVLLLALFKLFVRFEPRDDLQIYALTLLLFAAATAIHEGVTYGVLFGLYVLAGTLSLALFHLRVESSQQQVADEVDSNPFDRRYATVLAALSLVIFASSMLIFFAFPRVGMGFFMSQSRDRQSVSGFNDSVELGDHGSIRDNPQVVMRVEFPEGRPDDYQSLHWRAMTFDDYDGERWSQSLEDTDEEALPSRRNIFEFDERHEEFHPDFSRDTDPMPVEIYLEPLGTNIMPRLWPTDEVILGQEEVHIHWDPNKGEITSDVYGDLRHTVESDVGVAYNQSVLGEPDPERLREQQVSGASDMPGDNYLELPEVSGSFEELADEVTAGAETPYEKAEAVSEHLESNYEYTTDLPELGSKAPVEEFLFETERGHCEYFASAAALLLREAEVPTRVVNGFLGGSWNSVGEYLTVRQGDAHSWIEVYVPNFGWTPVDPTPAADVLPVEPGPLEQWLRDTSDTVRMTWMKWVIEYDLQSQ
ncbi:MAG: transglutaminaseTgpA domain-containing protein, partial [Persicimonas sp.]